MQALKTRGGGRGSNLPFVGLAGHLIIAICLILRKMAGSHRYSSCDAFIERGKSASMEAYKNRYREPKKRIGRFF